jgi:hypothetical protein
MNAPTSVFQLGRMRHLDLLALWHQLHPDSHQRDALAVARLSAGQLATTILQGRPPRT